LVLAGRFSYGDYLRCGAHRGTGACHGAVELPVNAVSVLGVCNGIQILCEAGCSGRADAQWGQILCRDSSAGRAFRYAFTRGYMPASDLPTAHGEGNYVADSETIARLEGEGRWCSATRRRRRPRAVMDQRRHHAIAGIVTHAATCSHDAAPGKSRGNGVGTTDGVDSSRAC